MSSTTQVDMDWAGTESIGQGWAGGSAAAVPVRPASTKYLSDEEILGIDPPSPKSGFGGQGPREDQAQDPTAAVARLFRGGESREVGDPAAVDRASGDEGMFPGSKD